MVEVFILVLPDRKLPIMSSPEFCQSAVHESLLAPLWSRPADHSMYL